MTGLTIFGWATLSWTIEKRIAESNQFAVDLNSFTKIMAFSAHITKDKKGAWVVSQRETGSKGHYKATGGRVWIQNDPLTDMDYKLLNAIRACFDSRFDTNIKL